MNKLKTNQAGFTIIELAISTTVFSVLLLLSLGAVAQIGKMYYKGVTTAQTQEVSRAVSNEIIQAIQLNAGGVTETDAVPAGLPVPPTNGSFCVGNTRYSYILNKSLVLTASSSQHVLWADTLPSCASVPHAPVDLTMPVPPGGGRELLGANMRLSELVIEQVAGSTQLYNIKLGILYGHDNVLSANQKQCTGSFASAQFCAVVNLETTVKKRL